MVFEGLNVEVEGDTADLVSALEVAKQQTQELGDETEGLSLRMQVLQGRVDEAEEEIDAAGRSAATTAASMGTLAGSATTASGSFAALQSSVSGVGFALTPLALSTVPALGSALASAAVSAGALAGSFGILLGAGAVSRMEEITEALGEARKEIQQIIEPLGAPFGDLILGGIRELPALARDIVNSIGGVRRFRGFLIDIGRTARRVLPDLVGGMFDLAREALPELRNVIGFFMREGPGAFRAMQRAAAEVAPEIRAFLDELIQAGPEILRFSVIMTNSVLPPLTRFVDTLEDGLRTINRISEGVQDFRNSIPGQILEMGLRFNPVTGQAAFASRALEATGGEGGDGGGSGGGGGGFGVASGLADSIVSGGFVSGARVPGGAQFQGGPTVNVQVGQINANSRSEGREAARGLRDELKSKNATGGTRSP